MTGRSRTSHRRGGSRPESRGPIDLKELRLLHRRINELKPFDRNARTHSDRQIQQLAASIAEHGFTAPILTDGGDTILAGQAGTPTLAASLSLSRTPLIQQSPPRRMLPWKPTP